jgi:hypothetical protein
MFVFFGTPHPARSCSSGDSVIAVTGECCAVSKGAVLAPVTGACCPSGATDVVRAGRWHCVGLGVGVDEQPMGGGGEGVGGFGEVVGL